MSAILAVYQRDGAPIERAHFGEMLKTINHRGPDGSNTHIQGSVALGHQRFIANLEDEEQPISDANRNLFIVLDGRVDNRKELLTSLGIMDQSTSDAALILTSYRRWGRSCFERLVGVFGVVIYDRKDRSMIIARDPLGDRTLFYHLTRELLIVSTEERAILSDSRVNRDLNTSRLACYFAIRGPMDGATFFSSITELSPGSIMTIDPESTHTERYWEPEFKPITYRSDSQYADHFFELLTQSIRCRLRASTPPAIMMSGGLDSTSIAAIACENTTSEVSSFSWAFDKLSLCDETDFIRLTAKKLNLDATLVKGDHAWTLANPQTWFLNPNSPLENPYRNLKQLVYREARKRGHRTLMSGVFGNHLYSGEGHWLGDLLREHRYLDAFWGQVAQIRMYGLLRGLVNRSTRLALPFMRTNRYRKQKKPPWLTQNCWDLLPEIEYAQVKRPRQAEVLLGPTTARSSSAVQASSSVEGIELIFPYRDRRLVEFMLNVPAHQLYHRGKHKHILRQAMKGRLPEAIRTQFYATSLTPLFTRGIREREKSYVDSLLSGNLKPLTAYIEPAWIKGIRSGSNRLEFQELVFWRCLSFLGWTRLHP